jgi:D-alanyl-D-alanine dipeptidase
MIDGFAFVDEVVPAIRWDSKYATWDNFTGRPVDGYLANRIVGTTALCAALERAGEAAAARGFGLLLWDGYRPQRAVECFLRWAQQPEDGPTNQTNQTKRRYYPNIARREMFDRGYVARRSGHSRGSTVDLTLYHLGSGELAAMAGDHDLMDPISHHGAPGLDPVEERNRRLLLSVMESSGFVPYPTEWWHYTLDDEPFPDSYFDFPISSESPSRTALTPREVAAR